MKIYLIIICVTYILILLFNMNHGLKNGFVRELRGYISILLAVLTIAMIGGILKGVLDSGWLKTIAGVVLLVLLGVLTRVLNAALKSLDSLAKLPLVRWLDSGLGFVLGFVKGFAIIYALEYFLRYFLMN